MRAFDVVDIDKLYSHVQRTVNNMLSLYMYFCIENNNLLDLRGSLNSPCGLFGQFRAK